MIQELVEGTSVLRFLGPPAVEEAVDDRVGQGLGVTRQSDQVSVGEVLDVAHVHEAVQDPVWQLDVGGAVEVDAGRVEQPGAVEQAAATVLVARPEQSQSVAFHSICTVPSPTWMALFRSGP